MTTKIRMKLWVAALALSVAVCGVALAVPIVGAVAPRRPPAVTIDRGPRLVSASPIATPRTSLGFLTIDSFSKRLSDGDRVNVVIEDGGVAADRVEIRLRTAKKGMWKKAVEFHTDGSTAHSSLQSENLGITTPTTVLQRDFARTYLVFAKAKVLGVYTPMYELPGSQLTPLLGKRIIFDWMQD